MNGSNNRAERRVGIQKLNDTIEHVNATVMELQKDFEQHKEDDREWRESMVAIVQEQNVLVKSVQTAMDRQNDMICAIERAVDNNTEAAEKTNKMFDIYQKVEGTIAVSGWLRQGIKWGKDIGLVALIAYFAYKRGA